MLRISGYILIFLYLYPLQFDKMSDFVPPATVKTILEYMTIQGDAEDETTLLGSMLKAMGATLSTDAEDVALLSADDITSIKADWWIPSHDPFDDGRARPGLRRSIWTRWPSGRGR